MPIRYREVLEHMQGYLAAYPLGFEADETGQRIILNRISRLAVTMVDFDSSSGTSSFGRFSAFLQGSSPRIEFAILNPAIVNQTSHSRRRALARNINLCCFLFVNRRTLTGWPSGRDLPHRSMLARLAGFLRRVGYL